MDWGKNEFFRSHASLFLPADRQDAPYYYVGDEVEMKPAYVRRLDRLVPRLEMLGYTLDHCREYYQAAIAEAQAFGLAVSHSFDAFADDLRRVDVSSFTPSDDEDWDPGTFATRGVLGKPPFTAVDPLFAELTEEHGSFFEHIEPYLILRLLAENPSNSSLDVVWRFHDVVEAGWIDEDSLRVGASPAEAWLIVTEGSTDSAVLKAALPSVLPELVDFFDFIDMRENYPFTGTGNLYRFCQGLARIAVRNRILVILDNDAVGLGVYRRISEIDLPENMAVTVLPDLNDCGNMRTLGPTGTTVADVNGRAVAIECFLDLAAGPAPSPVVRWTGYVSDSDSYQGELQQKEVYTRIFLETMKRGQPYDLAKLRLLWNHLVRCCTQRSPISPAHRFV